MTKLVRNLPMLMMALFLVLGLNEIRLNAVTSASATTSIKDFTVDESAEYVTNHINIKVKDGASTGFNIMSYFGFTTNSLDFSNYGIKSIKEIGLKKSGQSSIQSLNTAETSTWYSATLDGSSTVQDVLKSLENDDRIVFAEPDYIRKIEDYTVPSASTDPSYNQQWYLDAIKAPEAWAYLESQGINPGGSRDVIVAVIDTGVDYNHIDLSGSMWVNSREIPNNSIDDDHNGYVDDYYGINTITGSGNPMDDHGHGTHVAGIIGMVGNNQLGGVGIAFNVQIMAIKAASVNGYLTSANIAKAINYAYINGADVINMSFGGNSASTIEKEALERAYSTSVLVAAAGNSGVSDDVTSVYPAAYEWVIGVMASDATGSLAYFSNHNNDDPYNSTYDVMAPGVNIYSTLPNNKHASWSGTSMAAPIVSASAALIRSLFIDKSIYSSRFVMGQIVSTNDSDNNLNLYKALTALPKPAINIDDYWLFDNTDLSASNNQDGVIDAGETVDIGLQISNRWGAATNIQVTMDTEILPGVNDPYVTIIDDSSAFGDLSTFATQDNGFIEDNLGTIIGVSDPIKIKLADNTPNDHVIILNLTLSANNDFDTSDNAIYGSERTFKIIIRNGTILQQFISEDITLTKDKLWIIDKPTLVEKGATVTIEPGTVIQFFSTDSKYPYTYTNKPYLKIDGTWNSYGTESEPIQYILSEHNKNEHIYITDKTGMDSYSNPGYITNIGYSAFNGVADFRYSKIENPMITGDYFDHVGFYGNGYTANCQLYGITASHSQFKDFGNSSCSLMQYNHVISAESQFINVRDYLFRVFGNDNVFINTNVDSSSNIPVIRRDYQYTYTSPIKNESNGHYYFAFKHYKYSKILLGSQLGFVNELASKFGGYVTTINDEQENQFVQDYINNHILNAQEYASIYPYGDYYENYSYQPAFIIGYNNFNNGQYSWLNQENSTYLNYRTGYPTIASSHYNDLEYNFSLTMMNNQDGKWSNQDVYKCPISQCINYLSFYSNPDLNNFYIIEIDENGSALDRNIIQSEIDNLLLENYNTDFYNNAILNNWYDLTTNSWMKFTTQVSGLASANRNWQIINHNFWGTSNALIDAAIYDNKDNPTYNKMIYEPLLLVPSETTYPFVYKIDVLDSSNQKVTKVGFDDYTINAYFNRSMNTQIEPLVAYGPAAPFNDFPIAGSWVNDRLWSGKISISPKFFNGYQYFNVSGAVAADDSWLTTGSDSGRLRFEVNTNETASMSLQASGEENQIRLMWSQNDYELLAGYNLYRSETSDGTYSKINNTLIPNTQIEYVDTGVNPGKVYFYKFTVVLTDFSESTYSNMMSSSAIDTILPVINHMPINNGVPSLPVTISALITDNIEVKETTLYYKQKNSPSWTSKVMTNIGTNNFTATIEGSFMTSPGVYYYIQATDGVGIARSGSSSVPYMITINDDPKIISLSPQSGSSIGGETIILSGTNFKQGATVHFGDSPASSVVINSENRITVVTPAHFPAIVDVTVTNPDGYTNTLLNAYTYQGVGTEISLPETEAYAGQSIEIPVFISGVSGLLGANFDVNYDPTYLSLTGIRTGNLTSNFSLITNTNTPGLIRTALAGVNLISGNGSLMILEFMVLDQPSGSKSTLSISSATFNDGAIQASLINGSFTMSLKYKMSGTVVYYSNGNPVPGVNFTLAGLKRFYGLSLDDGTYLVSGIETGDYTLSASKIDNVNGISASDASYALMSSVGLYSLNGYQTIAGDVNGNGVVNAMDASYILQTAAGVRSGVFPGSGKVWEFILATQNYTGIESDFVNQNHIAILLGDITGNWTNIQN